MSAQIADSLPARAAPAVVSPWLPYPSAHGRLGEVFIAVIDTSVITSDVINTLKGKLPSPLMTAMATGLVRGFMTHSTWAEVPRVLARRAGREKFDAAAAERIWWRSYVPNIRFVAARSLPRADPALERALGERDASDVPTLRLASLIAPVVVLAYDRDLRDIGLAYERWNEIPEAVRRMVIGQGGTELAARVLFGAGYGAVAAVRGLAVAVQRPRVAVTLAGLALIAALTSRYWYPPVKRWVAEMSPDVRELADKAGRAIAEGFERYAAAASIWASAQHGRPGATLTHRVARMLATSPKPMTRTEMTERLTNQVERYGHRAVMTELLRILGSHQAFCEISPGRWQLGKSSADFGGLALPEGQPAYEMPFPATRYILIPGQSGTERAST
jgi:hypothetical protein